MQSPCSSYSATPTTSLQNIEYIYAWVTIDQSILAHIDWYTLRHSTISRSHTEAVDELHNSLIQVLTDRHSNQSVCSTNMMVVVCVQRNEKIGYYIYLWYVYIFVFVQFINNTCTFLILFQVSLLRSTRSIHVLLILVVPWFYSH